MFINKNGSIEFKFYSTLQVDHDHRSNQTVAIATSYNDFFDDEEVRCHPSQNVVGKNGRSQDKSLGWYHTVVTSPK